MAPLITLFFVAALVSCAGGKAVVAETGAAPSSAMPTASATASSSSSSSRLVTSPCVAHAGGGKMNSKAAKTADAGAAETPQGSCWYTAECVREPGKAMPGDGSVRLSCSDDLCTCTTESTADRRQQVYSFSPGAPCTDGELARKLLVEQCMAGMPPPN